MYVVAITPQLDVQEKGKVSEKEFSDVSNHSNNIMVHIHVYVQCHSIHAYMYVPNIHVRFVPYIGLFQILPGILKLQHADFADIPIPPQQWCIGR